MRVKLKEKITGWDVDNSWVDEEIERHKDKSLLIPTKRIKRSQKRVKLK